jgi:hypothetical protein
MHYVKVYSLFVWLFLAQALPVEIPPAALPSVSTRAYPACRHCEGYGDAVFSEDESGCHACKYSTDISQSKTDISRGRRLGCRGPGWVRSVYPYDSRNAVVIY